MDGLGWWCGLGQGAVELRHGDGVASGAAGDVCGAGLGAGDRSSGEGFRALCACRRNTLLQLSLLPRPMRRIVPGLWWCISVLSFCGVRGFMSGWPFFVCDCACLLVCWLLRCLADGG